MSPVVVMALPEYDMHEAITEVRWSLLAWAMLLGLESGFLICFTTEFYTPNPYISVREVEETIEFNESGHIGDQWNFKRKVSLILLSTRGVDQAEMYICDEGTTDGGVFEHMFSCDGYSNQLSELFKLMLTTDVKWSHMGGNGLRCVMSSTEYAMEKAQKGILTVSIVLMSPVVVLLGQRGLVMGICFLSFGVSLSSR